MSETRTVVEEFYRRLDNGETNRLGELFADEIEWDIYGAEEVPWTGRRTTRQQAVEFFATLPDHLQPEDFAVLHLLVEGTEAVALGTMRHIVKATGKTFSSPFAFHFTVADGKITRYVTFEDSLALARAFEAV
ncbi:nuclear transport factor 2 family protein [Streptomyces lydicus]|uniref:nuclear transport factor 2 family protein n=1 Tax=Streptomyces lydicus TaxID=47763 RepID=UPI00099FDD18|nr:nuclear transport factor 2 family protein [Streptomyces lydicus]